MIALSRQARVWATLLLAVAASGTHVGARQSAPRGVASQVIDLASAQPVSSAGAPRLTTPVAPGSILQLPALIAALESGAISPATRIACPGFVDVNGRRLACPHPRVRRPLTPAEALSYSCNTFFAAVGARLSRDRLNTVLESLGLPRVARGVSMPLAATGTDSPQASPAALLQAFARIVSGTDGLAMRSATRSVILEGLRGAAVFGTAAGFAARGVGALALTGGTRGSTPAADRIVLVAWPAERPSRAAVVLTARDTLAAAVEDAVPLTRAVTKTPPAVPAPVPAGVESQPASANPSSLSVRVGFAGGGGYRVETLDLEDYVARVLAGEAAPRSAPAALEALAITIRTFALANRNRHGRDGFDLCDQTHCQVLRPSYAAARAAASATAGLVLSWNGAPASVYYTASCGGITERPSNVWPGAPDPPFMPVGRDTACDDEPPWSIEITADDVRRALVAAGFRGARLRDVRVARRDESARVMSLTLDGMTPGEISGQALRMTIGRTLGWRLLKSTAFDVRRTTRGYRFSGRGFGHGVGFCVIGATRRAAAGATRASLLNQYFPGLPVARVTADLLRAPVLSPADPETPLESGEAGPVDVPTSRRTAPRASEPAPASTTTPSSPAPAAPASGGQERRGVTLVLPAADERERALVAALVERALVAARARTGRQAPPRVDVVFHPSRDSFEQATGEPPWSAGLSRPGRIDFPPVAALRDRGTLDDTIAHEAAHVVTSAALAGRARWVQEGAALFASGTIREAEIARAALDRTRPPCPSDQELQRSSSEAAYTAALARARQCFARALASGLRWDEVR